MSNDETQPASGSRWEPAEQPPATPPTSTTTPAAASPVAYAPAPTRQQPGSNRGRLLLAGGAVGIALVAGAGGFALGHASADDGREGGQLWRQGPGGFPGGPQGTFPGPGQPGQQQPPDGFPDPRSDDDGQPLPDGGAGPGSSTS